MGILGLIGPWIHLLAPEATSISRCCNVLAPGAISRGQCCNFHAPSITSRAMCCNVRVSDATSIAMCGIVHVPDIPSRAKCCNVHVPGIGIVTFMPLTPLPGLHCMCCNVHVHKARAVCVLCDQLTISFSQRTVFKVKCFICMLLMVHVPPGLCLCLCPWQWFQSWVYLCTCPCPISTTLFMLAVAHVWFPGLYVYWLHLAAH